MHAMNSRILQSEHLQYSFLHLLLKVPLSWLYLIDRIKVSGQQELIVPSEPLDI